MKLYYDKRLKDPTYYAQMGFRKDGKATTRNVRKIGKHSELLAITDDPLAYAREEINKMNEEYRTGRVDFNVQFDFNEKLLNNGSEFSSKSSLNIGYFFLQYIYGQLDLASFFRKATRDSKITFDCSEINRFLTFARIMEPASKLATTAALDTFFENTSIGYQHILRHMDVLAGSYTDYIGWLYKKSGNIVERDSSVFYYDCSNVYFECEQADEPVIDEVTGEVIYGLRQYGISKEHRPNPIVEMGLLIDRRGIPVSMCIDPGNTSEQVTAIPLEKDAIKITGCSRFIYCADAGLGSYNIRRFNSMGGRAFVVTQSIKKMSDVLKEAVFNDCDYRLLSNDVPVTLEEMRTFDRMDEGNLALYNDHAYKIINADMAVDLGLYEIKTLKNGRTRRVKSRGVLDQHVIVTFSRKMMEYQRAVRNRQIERARSIIRKKDPEEIKKGPSDVRRFMKRIAMDSNGDDVAVSYIIDEERIREEEKYDGFYAVATNLDDPAVDILKIVHERYRIEDCFRILKTNFDARPVYHRDADHIRAHFLICYTALLVYRLLECRLEDQGTPVTSDNLITTLRNMSVTDINGISYMSLYHGSSTLDALIRLTGLKLDHKYYRPSDLKKMIKKIKK